MKTSFAMFNLTILAGLLVNAMPMLAQQFPPDVQKSASAIRDHINKMGGNGAGEIIHRSEGGVGTTFASHHMIIVRFRQFPVARILPEGLGASNVFAVDKVGKFEHLNDIKALEKFFRANHPPVTNDGDAKAILAAWLTLTQEFHQDGMLKFEVLDKEFTVEGDRSKAIGRAVVMQGGNGDLKAELAYDKDGKLANVVEEASIRQGPRPKCQATLLLDANPLVRKIAEQDLVIMGLSARGYIMEQRQLATPDLREAIDRVWRQIEKNGW